MECDRGALIEILQRRLDELEAWRRRPYMIQGKLDGRVLTRDPFFKKQHIYIQFVLKFSPLLFILFLYCVYISASHKFLYFRNNLIKIWVEF